MKKVQEKQRLSNYELMRIVSIFLVVLGHTFSWGGVTSHSTDAVRTIIYIIYGILIVHVNSFILVSGYFQSKSKFKLKKAIKLFFYMWFYTLVITLIGIKAGWFTLTKSEIIRVVLPIDFSSYWFIKAYIVLYCISPFLNKAISALSKRNYNKLLFVLFVFCSIITTLSNQSFFPNARGFSVLHFIFMYLIGAYIRKYESELKIKKFWKLLLVFIGCFALNYGLYRLGLIISDIKFGFQYIGINLKDAYMGYDNPLVIFGSIAYFMIFGLLKIKSRIVNYLSKHVLDVYMIHETTLFRSVLYTSLGLTASKYTSWTIIPKVFLIAGIIVIGCTIFAYIVEYFIKLMKLVINKLGIAKFLANKFKKAIVFINEYFVYE